MARFGSGGSGGDLRNRAFDVVVVGPSGKEVWHQLAIVPRVGDWVGDGRLVKRVVLRSGFAARVYTDVD